MLIQRAAGKLFQQSGISFERIHTDSRRRNPQIYMAAIISFPFLSFLFCFHNLYTTYLKECPFGLVLPSLTDKKIFYFLEKSFYTFFRIFSQLAFSPKSSCIIFKDTLYFFTCTRFTCMETDHR